MKKIMCSIIILFLFTACQNKKNEKIETNTTAQHTRSTLQSKSNATQIAHKSNQPIPKVEENISQLEQLGIKVDGSKVIIDTNKTKQFFKHVTKQLQSKVIKIQEELKEGSLEEKGVGIEINKTEVKIDLNKTKKFLENWKEKIKVFVNGLDEAGVLDKQKLDPSLPNSSTNLTH